MILNYTIVILFHPLHNDSNIIDVNFADFFVGRYLWVVWFSNFDSEEGLMMSFKLTYRFNPMALFEGVQEFPSREK